MDNYLHIEMPAVGMNEGLARSIIGAFCLPCKPTIEELNDVRTAVSEAVTNAVVHAYDGEGKIVLSAIQEGKTVTVTVSDFGKGIASVEQAIAPFFTTKPYEERSGMGFTIISTFTDDMKVDSTLGLGTTVTMKKTFCGC